MGQCRLKERMKRLSHIYCFFSLASYALFIDTARMQPAQIEALFSAIDLSLSFSCHSRGHGILHVLNRISDWRAFNHCPIQAGTAVNFFFFCLPCPLLPWRVFVRHVSSILLRWHAVYSLCMSRSSIFFSFLSGLARVNGICLPACALYTN